MAFLISAWSMLHLSFCKTCSVCEGIILLAETVMLKCIKRSVQIQIIDLV